MNVELITFGTKNYRVSAGRLLLSATKYNIPGTLYTGKQFSKTVFYKNYNVITRQKRGFGYWLWKPYYIFEKLQSMSEGAVLIYSDAGHEIVANPLPLIEKAIQNPVVLFENYQGVFYLNRTTLPFSDYNYYVEINKIKYWVKTDALKTMALTDSFFLESPSVDASFIIIRKCKESVSFVAEWLKYCTNIQVLTDTVNIEKNNSFFLEHRHDQSVISLLAAKYSLELFRCPSQFGNHYKLPHYRMEGEVKILPYSNTPKENSDFPTITKHYRDRFELFPRRLLSFLEREWDFYKKSINSSK